ncbi:Jouberin [Merluccius polli]|uniref:Jouberin n=1 Tax=Merluccius polli TaxID=89951 RepID=A0AA47P5N5_MERPO|nr:Jouberin [Merluccius polli]
MQHCSMQQIYMQSDEQFEVFTTVFSPQVCRSRVRTQSTDEDKVVATINYRAHCPEELDLSHGDVIQVLLKEDPSWWFGRLHNGNEGYFPSACVTTRGPSGESGKATPSLLRRGSVPVVIATPASPCSHPGTGNGLGTPRLPRKNSIRRALALDSPSTMGSPSLLHRVLAKSRRKSCPHLPHVSADPGSINSAYLPD